jgi:hypothetical protein
VFEEVLVDILVGLILKDDASTILNLGGSPLPNADACRIRVLSRGLNSPPSPLFVLFLLRVLVVLSVFVDSADIFSQLLLNTA